MFNDFQVWQCSLDVERDHVRRVSIFTGNCDRDWEVGIAYPKFVCIDCQWVRLDGSWTQIRQSLWSGNRPQGRQSCWQIRDFYCVSIVTIPGVLEEERERLLLSDLNTNHIRDVAFIDLNSEFLRDEYLQLIFVVNLSDFLLHLQ